MAKIGEAGSPADVQDCKLAMEFREETELAQDLYIIALESAVDKVVEGSPEIKFIKNRDIDETPFGSLKKELGTGNENNFVYNVILPDFISLENIITLEESYFIHFLKERRMHLDSFDGSTDLKDINDFLSEERRRLSEEGYRQLVLNNHITCYMENNYRTNTMDDLVIEIALGTEAETERLTNSIRGNFGLKNKIEFIKTGRRVQIKALQSEDPVETNMLDFNNMLSTWELTQLWAALSERFNVENVLVRQGKLDRQRSG